MKLTIFALLFVGAYAAPQLTNVMSLAPEQACGPTDKVLKLVNQMQDPISHIVNLGSKYIL